MIGRYDVEERAAVLWPGKHVRWVCGGELNGVLHWVVQLEGEVRPHIIIAETGEEI